MAKTKKKPIAKKESKGYGTDKLNYSKPSITSRYPTRTTDPVYTQPLSKPLPTIIDSRMQELSDIFSYSNWIDIERQIGLATKDLEKKLKKKRHTFDYL